MEAAVAHSRRYRAPTQMRLPDRRQSAIRATRIARRCLDERESRQRFSVCERARKAAAPKRNPWRAERAIKHRSSNSTPDRAPPCSEKRGDAFFRPPSDDEVGGRQSAIRATRIARRCLDERESRQRFSVCERVRKAAAPKRNPQRAERAIKHGASNWTPDRAPPCGGGGSRQRSSVCERGRSRRTPKRDPPRAERAIEHSRLTR